MEQCCLQFRENCDYLATRLAAPAKSRKVSQVREALELGFESEKYHYRCRK